MKEKHLKFVLCDFIALEDLLKICFAKLKEKEQKEFFFF